MAFVAGLSQGRQVLLSAQALAGPLVCTPTLQTLQVLQNGKLGIDRFDIP